MRIEDNNANNQEQETHVNAESSNSENGSHVWHHFEVLQDKIHAECKICRRKEKSVKYKFHGTTSNMIYHLYNEHGITKDNQTGYISFFFNLTIFNYYIIKKLIINLDRGWKY